MRSSAQPESRREARAGITLIEMLVVVTIVGLMVSISYPSFTAGLDGIRLRTSIHRAAAFFSEARQRADRSQQAVQFAIDTKRNVISAVSVDGVWREGYALTDGLRIVVPKEPVSYMLFPGGTAPGLELMFEAGDGGRRGFRINVFSGVAEDWKAEEKRQ